MTNQKISFTEEKKMFMRNLGLVFEHQVAVLDYTIQTMADIKQFTTDFPEDNIPLSINKFKIYKQKENMVSKEDFISNFNHNSLEVLLQQRVRQDVGLSLKEKGAERIYDIISIDPNHSAESLLSELERPTARVYNTENLYEGII
ncbi:hypothetical protein [Halobacillus andaensis]|uniref:hypothetical protein n=1 Tax=Halobacillus andaensis TaxID=1176239 RepID=UPI003D75A9ED